MDPIAMLRAKALSDPPKARYPMCLDREARAHIAGLRAQYARKANELARSERSQPPKSLGESATVVDVESILGELEEAIEAAQEAAKGDSVVVIFRRLPATAESAGEGEPNFTTLEREHTDDKGVTDFAALGSALLPLCYERTDSIHGDLGMSWSEVLVMVDAGDLGVMRDMIVGHHRIGSAIPFDPVSSGPPATT